MTRLFSWVILAFLGATTTTADAEEIRATGDLGVVVERTTGSVLIIDQSDRSSIS